MPSQRPEIICEGYKFSFQCPKTFWELDATDVQDVSYCNECQRSVFLCNTPEEVAYHESAGHCIAVMRESSQAGFGIGVVERVPEVSDSLITLHRSFTKAIDTELTDELRDSGFSGPRTFLTRKSDSFVEFVEIVTRAADCKGHIWNFFSFSEVEEKLHNKFRIHLSGYPQNFCYGNLDLRSTVHSSADEFRSTRSDTLKEMQRVWSVLADVQGNSLPRPLTNNAKLEESLSDIHMAVLFQLRGNTELAQVLARLALEKLTAKCTKQLRLLERNIINESECVHSICTNSILLDNLDVLMRKDVGILPFDEVYSAFPPTARKVLLRHSSILLDYGPADFFAGFETSSW